jgi:transcriptional regulator with XRE-family HTH domain
MRFKLRSGLGAKTMAHGKRRSATSVDIWIGRRVKSRRLELGMSQEQLAELLGITFQQVQKYEKGVNRIAASRLFDIAAALEASTNYFFEELTPPPARKKRMRSDVRVSESDRLMAHFTAIGDANARAEVIEFALNMLDRDRSDGARKRRRD